MTLLHSIRADPKERALLEAYNKRLSIEATYAEDLAEERSQRLRAEANERSAEAERQQAEAGRQQAEAERQQADAKRERAEEAAEVLRSKLRAFGIDPDAVG